MGNFLFKLEYTVRGLMIQPKAVFVFEYGGPHNVKVVLHAPSNEEQTKGHSISNAFCTSSSSIEPNEKIRAIFDKIAANQIIPQDDSSTSVSCEYPSPDGFLIRIPTLSSFPENFRSFMNNVSSELQDWAMRSVSVLRWRENEQGPHNPISSRGLYWSTDGSFWHPAPSNYGVRVDIKGSINPKEEDLTFIRDIVKANGNEPLYHDLFREAWEQRYNNPRSALVIGIAAAELSVKRYISALVPEAEWLATNLPTPPLVRMIVDYLPNLPARNKIDNKVKPLPKRILDTLNKGITMRNQLSHAGSVNPSGDSVEEVLEAVHDLLWLIDFYIGFDWAIEFLRPETKAELLAG